MDVEYKPIPGFSHYLVSGAGEIINVNTGNKLKGTADKAGYIRVCLIDDLGKRATPNIHRIVAEAFCPGREPETEVNHIDGDKSNNSADNLEWVPHSVNLKHAYETGLREDDASPRAVIGTNIESGEQMCFSSIYKAARFLGISQGNICMCCRGIRPYASGYYWEYEDE